MIDPLKWALRRSALAGPAADAYGLLTSPSTTLRLWKDALETRREASFARALPPPKADAPLLLVLSMTNAPYNAKTEAMLAFAAARHGWRVQVLTSRVYTTARRIFGAYGFNDFLNYEDILQAEPWENAQIAAEVSRRSTEPADFQSVLAWSYRDAWIGPQLLSSISRRRFDGAPDPRDPAVRSALLEQLPQSLSFVHAAERQLARTPPATILVNEPNYHILGPFVDVAIARGIPVVHYTQPSRDDALVFKKLTRETRRIHPNSITPVTFDGLLARAWTSTEDLAVDEEFAQRYGGVWKIQGRNQPGTREIPPDEVRRAFDLPPDKPVAAVFSHVLWDANLFYGEDVFENYGEWFIETVSAAVANPRATWLIKLHPANIWKRKLSGVSTEYGEMRLIRERIGTLPDHVRLLSPDTPVNTMSLFKAIDVGITVRGSVGYELPCFGVPVVTAGTGRYSGFGFTYDYTDRKAYIDALSRVETIPRLSPEMVHRARVHAHAIFCRRPWAFSSFRTEIGDDVSDCLFQNLRPSAPPVDPLSPLQDLDRFAEWLADPHSIDYVSP